MQNFWNPVIKPVLERLQPKAIVEIGSEHGHNTRQLLGYCQQSGAKLHVIDPAPQYDVAAWQQEYGKALTFYRSLSLNAISLLDKFDVVLIDGDHNWYTVFHELKLIEKQSNKQGQPFPVVMLHDVSWPYGRRDLYYNPETIPVAYRQPFQQKGMQLGTPELLDNGGLNSHLFNAIYENNLQNGVLTAVEDFLQSTTQAIDLVKVPALHGLGILIPGQLLEQKSQLAELIAALKVPSEVEMLIEQIEAARLAAEIEGKEHKAASKQIEATSKQQVEQLQAQVAKTQQQLKQAESQQQTKLQQIEATSKEQVEQLQAQVAEYQQQLQQVETAYKDELEQLKQAESQQQTKLQQIEATSKEQVEQLQAQVAEYQQQLQQVETAYKDELEQMQAQVIECQQQLQQTKLRHKTELQQIENTSTSKVEQLQAQVDNLQKSLADTKLTASNTEATSKSKVEQLQTQVDNLQKSLADTKLTASNKDNQLKQSSQHVDALVRLFEQMDRLVNSMMSSNRWRLGDILYTSYRKILFKPLDPPPQVHRDTFLERFQNWKKKYQSLGSVAEKKTSLAAKK